MADALISPSTGLGFYAVSAGLLAYSAKKTSQEESYERKLPLMGVLGAFIFAAQMINFTIPGTGSSGHIGGGMLLAILLGPSAAFLAIASVLLVQCLFFADGGLLALGCNIFNLGFWPCFVGFPLYRWLTRRHSSIEGSMLAALFSVMLSLELGAFGVVIQTLLSGRSELPFAQFSILMLSIHLPIAMVEGLITAGMVQFVHKLIPDSGEAIAAEPSHFRAPALVALAGCVLFVGMILAWFASSQPDGLEWSISRVSGQEELSAPGQGVAQQLQSIQEKTAFLPDYAFPKSGNEAGEGREAWPAINPGTSIAGLLGALLTAGMILLTGVVLHTWRKRHAHT
ncbi:MAG: energy-coupling factor ABC transporter permease [Lentisphaerota bacterium]